ncbi:ER membrane protein DP1/Yop1 [Quaeritorhiza haematococci]|nr:ER membrane protein DP1/Yop1 [Quaeritorhiza haematococci]
MDKVAPYLDQADTFLSQFPLLNEVEKKVKVKYVKVAVAATAWLTVWTSVFFHIFPGFVTNVIGLAYPSYALFLAVGSSNVEALKQWSTYFLLFGLLNTVELGHSVLVSWFSFYYVAKVALLFWLFLPQYQGAKVVLDLAFPKIALLLKKHE